MATEDDEQIEEERRLLYVAMTRAKDHLHVSYPSRFYTYGFKNRHADRNMYSIRSRFLTDDMLQYFHREAYGRDVPMDSTEGSLEQEGTNISEKISMIWA